MTTRHHRQIMLAAVAAVANTALLWMADHRVWALLFGVAAPVLLVQEYVRAIKRGEERVAEWILGSLMVAQAACAVGWPLA